MVTSRIRRRPERLLALRSLPAFLAAAIVLAVPGGVARADSPSAMTGVAKVIQHGLVTVVQEGVVSWYGAAFHNRPTASGELFDSSGMTMAHPTLPFGTQVKVTNIRNGRSVVVRVNDRGPFVGQRIADLSRAAAVQIGMLQRGVAKVRIEVMGEDAEALSQPR